jgi:ParB family chromosome partitioning protein
MKEDKKRLGKGLAALMGEASLHYNSQAASNEFAYIKLADIEANIDQPRKNIAFDALNELATSINENGVLQPILVQKIAHGAYRIIAGERRWRAAKIAGLNEIPAIVKNYAQDQEFKVALIENIQRQELDAIEEAAGYLKLIEDFNYTQEQIASTLGKSRSHIANILRLNTLPQSVKDQLINNQITLGHAKILVGLDRAAEIANIFIEKHFNVRQAEQYIKNLGINDKNRQSKGHKLDIINAQKNIVDAENFTDPEMLKLQQMLSDKFSTKVMIEFAQLGGKITIAFDDLDQLDEILNKIR